MSGKRKQNGSQRDRYYQSSGTHDLSNPVSVSAMYVMKTERDREGKQAGCGPPVCDTVCACEEERFVQSGQLHPCDNTREGW